MANIFEQFYDFFTKPLSMDIDLEQPSNDSESLLDSLLFTAKENWKIEPDSLMENINKIAFHESAGTMDPTIHQRGGGPGRGLLQYEKTLIDKKTGKYKQAAGMTARNRLANILS